MDKQKYNIRNSFTIFIQPTNSCNLACKYCYISRDIKTEIMDEQTIWNILEKFICLSEDKPIHLLWHGGEPLLVGLDFYKKAIEIESRFGGKSKFENSIQTNGTLLTEEFADFFKKYNFSMGLSLDGPKELNDKTRIYKTNKSTFYSVLSSIKILRERGIETNVIITLNKKNIRQTTQIYQFLKEHKISARFNPLVRAGRAVENYEELSISPEEFKEAKLNIFNRWFSDKEPIHLYCFEDMLKNILSRNYICECTFTDSCQKSFISIAPQGDVYPCGEFSGIEKFRYGNINKNSLEDILSHPLRVNLLGREKNIRDCDIDCEYQKLCHGGCMSNAYGSTGNIMDKDPYCSAYKVLFKHIKSKIKYQN